MQVLERGMTGVSPVYGAAEVSLGGTGRQYGTTVRTRLQNRVRVGLAGVGLAVAEVFF